MGNRRHRRRSIKKSSAKQKRLPAAERARAIDLGNRITALLEAKKLSAADVARELDVSRGAVSNWTKGIRFPSGRHQIELARLFSTTLDELNGERRAA